MITMPTLPRHSNEPKSTSRARCALAVCGETPATNASYDAVRARPSSSEIRIAARPASPRDDATAASSTGEMSDKPCSMGTI